MAETWKRLKISPTLIDRTVRSPFTTLVRALGFSGDDEIFDIFGDSELVRKYCWKKISTKIQWTLVQTKPWKKFSTNALCPGEPKTAESSRSFVCGSLLWPTLLWFLAAAGRYKINKNSMLKHVYSTKPLQSHW